MTKASSQIKKFLNEGSWVAFGQLSSAFGMLVGIRILTEYVPPDVFGNISLLLGIISLGSGIFCVPLLQAALRFYPEMARIGELPTLRQMIEKSLFRSAALLGAIILLGGAIYSTLQGISYFPFLILTGLLSLEIIRALETNFLNAARQQRFFSLWITTESLTRVALAILAVVLIGPTPEAVLIGHLLGTGSILLIFLRYRDSKDFERREGVPNITLGLSQEICRYSFPLIPLAIVEWVSSSSGRYMVAGMMGLQQVGIYAAVYGLISKPFLMAQGILELTFRPIYYNAMTAKAVDSKKIFNTYLLLTAFLATLGVTIISHFSEVIIDLCLGPRYRSGFSLAPWIALGNGLLILSCAFYTRLHSYKLTKVILAIRASSSIFGIMTTLLLINWLGLIGAALACPIYFGLELLTLVGRALLFESKEATLNKAVVCLKK